VALNRLTYQEIFENLNPVDRTILMLTADGYPAQEIAQIVTRRHRQPFNAASVRKRKERALRALRRSLKQEMVQA
jgi:DNA-directed RNA polymerase specialized sigma24 family protein